LLLTPWTQPELMKCNFWVSTWLHGTMGPQWTKRSSRAHGMFLWRLALIARRTLQKLRMASFGFSRTMVLMPRMKQRKSLCRSLVSCTIRLSRIGGSGGYQLVCVTFHAAGMRCLRTHLILHIFFVLIMAPSATVTLIPHRMSLKWNGKSTKKEALQ